MVILACWYTKRISKDVRTIVNRYKDGRGIINVIGRCR